MMQTKEFEVSLLTYKAIAFFDLDGTLLDQNSQITPEVAAGMLQLKANGVLPVIATGRTEIEIQAIREAAHIDSNIVMNGAYIRVAGQEVYSDLIEKSQTERMYHAVLEHGDQLSYYNEGAIWCTGHSEDLIGAYTFIHSKIPPIDPLGFQDKPVNMLLVLGRNNRDFYEENFPEFDFYRNTPYSMDTVKKGISKGAAVKILQEKTGLTHLPTYGFGDGPNDFALLQACDYKIAMGNAVEELKQLADFVTKKNTEGGIIHALKHFQLI